ncbi:MAG: hypothetical protein MK082_04615 [Phycisphaerales bacterium]|nr:hypothetical protein [Phycisphaerales bacterium]
MEWKRTIRLLVAFLGTSMVGFCPVEDEPPVRSEHRARVVIDQVESVPLILTVHGQRNKDGRIRFIGSVDREDGALLVHWDLLCDPNPHGSASIDGLFEIVGPFEGSVRLDLPIDPLVEGPVALRTSSSLRARSDAGGVTFAVGPGECAWAALIDGRASVRHGRGPFAIERPTAGVTGTRSWSTGEAPDEPIVVKAVRDTMSVRTACMLEAGSSAILTGRVQLFGDPANFVFREDVAPELVESTIPRRSNGITIVVPGAGARGQGGSGQINKPSGVVRPSRPSKSDG